MQFFKISIFSWELKPGLTSTLVTAVLIPIFCALGHWQLQRMHFKNALQAQYVARLQSKPLKTFQQDSPNVRFTFMEITGHFLNDYTLLLDNQMYKGQAGYRVMTLFQVADSSKRDLPLILVDRGWIPITSNRNKLPDITHIREQVTLKGIINEPPKALKLNSITEPNGSPFPKIVQHIDFDKITEQLQHPVSAFVFQLHTEQPPYSYQILPISFGVSPNRHLGYAIQWYIMACVVLLYYLVINTKKIARIR